MNTPTRTMSIDALSADIRPSDIYKDLMETDIEVTEKEYFGILDYYSEREIINHRGVKNLLNEMDTEDIMSYLEEIGVKCQSY